MTTFFGEKTDLVKKCNKQTRMRKLIPTKDTLMWHSARTRGVAGKQQCKRKRSRQLITGMLHAQHTLQRICSRFVYGSFLVQSGQRIDTGPDIHTAAAADHTPLVATAAPLCRSGKLIFDSYCGAGMSSAKTLKQEQPNGEGHRYESVCGQPTSTV